MVINTQSVQLEIASSSSSENEDVLRCLNTLYGSRAGEQMLDRDFGLETDFLSYPSEMAQALYTAEVVRKTAIYEPRATVERVDYSSGEDDGGLVPKVVIKIG